MELAIQTIEMLVIPEGDIYRLVIKPQLPAAERFENWTESSKLSLLK